LSGQNKRKCRKRHLFKLLNESELKRNPIDSLYYYHDSNFIVGAECVRCGKHISNKTIIKILNKYTGVNK
jgi:hypothetical protein